MFCPKCGIQNPETGKFCRSCGTDLGNVSIALSGTLPLAAPLVDRKGQPINWESVVRPIFLGTAFFVVTIILALTGMGRGWWYWMLIPAFTIFGSGVARYVLLKKSEGQTGFRPAIVGTPEIPAMGQGRQDALPPPQAGFTPAAESRYKTGDLAPPSVTDDTTKHLQTNSEGETMTLPKI